MDWMQERLVALLQGLECKNIGELVTKPPETLRAVGAEIALAAKLGAPLYRARPSGDQQP